MNEFRAQVSPLLRGLAIANALFAAVNFTIHARHADLFGALAWASAAIGWGLFVLWSEVRR